MVMSNQFSIRKDLGTIIQLKQVFINAGPSGSSWCLVTIGRQMAYNPGSRLQVL